jgi:DNA-directed RNA polymerase specialized sigma24 family protein
MSVEHDAETAIAEYETNVKLYRRRRWDILHRKGIPPEVSGGWQPGDPTGRMATAIADDAELVRLCRLIRAVDMATVQLSARDAECIRLYYRLGHTQQDTADRLQICRTHCGNILRRFRWSVCRGL